MATYTLISSNVLSSSAASVTFSAIPADYTDLVLRCSSRDTQASVTDYYLNLNFNGDTATNYSITSIYNFGSAAASDRWTSQTNGYIYQDNSATATANTFANIEIYIPSYTVSQNKPYSSFGAPESNVANLSTRSVSAVAGLWRNTAAITSIVIAPPTSSFVSGSSFYLYGISSS